MARGIEEVDGMQAKVRTVPRVSTVCEATEGDVPDDGPPYATREDLETCAAMLPKRVGDPRASPAQPARSSLVQ